jgi:FkbM family methyltransferase
MSIRLKEVVKALFLKLGLSIRFAKHTRIAETSFLDLLSENVDCVLYVGANRGQMMEKFFKNFPATPIIMYEADPRLAAFLEKKYGGALVTVRNKAVGSENGKSDFYVSTGTDGQSSSLLHMGDRHLKWSPESAQRETIEVETIALDTEQLFGYKSIFLKIDIQGFELEAFKGATNLLKNVVAIDVEVSTVSMYDGDCNWLEVSNFLAALDFQLFDIDPWFHDHTTNNELLQADFRFVRSKIFSKNSA